MRVSGPPTNKNKIGKLLPSSVLSAFLQNTPIWLISEQLQYKAHRLSNETLLGYL